MYEQHIFRTMFFKNAEEIRIDGHTYPITMAAKNDHMNCKLKICQEFPMTLGHDLIDNLEVDNYVGWRKDCVKLLKEWDKIYLKHQKTANPDIVNIHNAAFKPLFELWEANLNFHNINQMIDQGKEVPVFRFEALEEQFVQKMTKICEIFTLFGNLEDHYNIRQMLEVLKTKDWKEIHPFAFYLQPLRDALDDVIKELLRMQKAGPLRNHYILEKNTDLMDKIVTMVKLDNTAQWLMGDELKRDQLRFIYGVHKTIYDSALKDTYLNPKTNELAMKTVVPALTGYRAMINIRDIDDAKALDVVKEAERLQRRADLKAQTGIDFDAEPEMPVLEVEETKAPKKKKKVEEVDPEEVERQRLEKIRLEEIAKYGVSLNLRNCRGSAPGSGSST